MSQPDTTTTTAPPPPETGTAPLTSLRSVGSLGMTADNLGPLKELPGFWQGTGFSLIARPDRSNPNGIFLQLNMLQEALEFTTIGSPVPNRGSAQDDISIFGVTYLHRVTDLYTGGALHIEPGMWLNIPPTSDPQAGPSIARMFTVPHGNAVCTIGGVEEIDIDGIPELPPISTVPFPVGSTPPDKRPDGQYPEYDLSKLTPYRTANLPPEITQELVDDPMVAVRAALAPQRLSHITRLVTSTSTGGSIGNIPFIKANADAPLCDSVWAVENVEGSDGQYLQLQYAQIVPLTFAGISYPHVTVGTLIKAF
jgi:hypothetical protein